MSSAQDADFWGVLINPDKSPSATLEHLFLGIAQVISSVDDLATADLTPDRLAAFYRKVGGNYDVLFLETRPSALSFIYQRLGCFHSIQPTADAYKPPCIPALQPNGFVRWQTIQLLLDPDEHWQYLQHALDTWDIEAPNGDLFPKTIPRDAFPAEPDSEMIAWHEEVSRRFELDFFKKNIMRASPPNFGSYHYHFNNKDSPPPPTQDDGYLRSRPRQAPRVRPFTPDQYRPPSDHHHHSRRKSAEYPTSTARKVQSTYFPRPEKTSGYRSPRAPSPPTWSQHAANVRGRGRAPAYSRPVSPGTIPETPTPHINVSSDASSEDSSSGPQRPPPPTKRTRHRNLSPPRPSHARRHSHEAYHRRPREDVSPEPSRRYSCREPPNAHTGRSYDSDGARRSRQTRTFSDEYIHPRPSGNGFREQVFPDSTAAPDVPMYTHVHPRYMNMNNVNMNMNGAYATRRPPDMELCAVDDPRRGGYRAGPAPGPGMMHPTPTGGPPERARASTGHRTRSQRYADPVGPGKRGAPRPTDVEYTSRGRRATMYDR